LNSVRLDLTEKEPELQVVLVLAHEVCRRFFERAIPSRTCLGVTLPVREPLDLRGEFSRCAEDDTDTVVTRVKGSRQPRLGRREVVGVGQTNACERIPIVRENRAIGAVGRFGTRRFARLLDGSVE
jgi:hypothetical protein